jgi:hypothetical protein
LAERRIAAPVGGIFICHLVLRKRRNEVPPKTALFEIARVLVRLDHVASGIVNANRGAM